MLKQCTIATVAKIERLTNIPGCATLPDVHAPDVHAPDVYKSACFLLWSKILHCWIWFLLTLALQATEASWIEDLGAKLIQWNPSVTDTIWTQHFVLCSEVSLTQGLPVYFR